MLWRGVLPVLRFAILRKNNERLLGVKMKKFVILLLVFAILGLTGCDMIDKIMGKEGPNASDICDIANSSSPTKITTDVTYFTARGDKLSGHYVTTTDGKDAIFDYYYEKLATPAESIESGDSSRITVYEGVVYYKDGAYFSGDWESWRPGTGTAFDLKFSVDEKALKDVVINEDGSALEAKVSKEDLASFIGTDLGAIEDASVNIVTNKVNLTMIIVSVKTASGEIVVRTSYTYNQQELFPKVESPETDEGVE